MKGNLKGGILTVTIIQAELAGKARFSGLTSYDRRSVGERILATMIIP